MADHVLQLLYVLLLLLDYTVLVLDFLEQVRPCRLLRLALVSFVGQGQSIAEVANRLFQHGYVFSGRLLLVRVFALVDHEDLSTIMAFFVDRNLEFRHL